jgi:hypothetical protein
MRKRVSRPKADEGKINSRNEFELCYLRHQYFRRVKYNPTEKEMKPFTHISGYLSKNTYNIYKNLFISVGLEFDDVKNIALVHLVSFLGLFAMQKMPEKLKDFSEKFYSIQGRNPNKMDILDKDQANFTLFMKQRMGDLVRVCRQKARNIKGTPVEEFYYYCGPTKPPKVLRELLKNYEKLGFKKLDSAIYKSIKKRVGSIFGMSFVFDGNYYVAVPLDNKPLSLEDFDGADINPRDSIHNMTPEEIYFTLEDEDEWENKKQIFFHKSTTKKVNTLKNFINVNKNKPEYCEEIRAARKLLRELV